MQTKISGKNLFFFKNQIYFSYSSFCCLFYQARHLRRWDHCAINILCLRQFADPGLQVMHHSLVCHCGIADFIVFKLTARSQGALKKFCLQRHRTLKFLFSSRTVTTRFSLYIFNTGLPGSHFFRVTFPASHFVKSSNPASHPSVLIPNIVALFR